MSRTSRTRRTSQTSQTFKAPNGVKLRCQSNRRYWVVEYWNSPDGVKHAQVLLRTDNPMTAWKALNKGQGRATFDSIQGTYR